MSFEQQRPHPRNSEIQLANGVGIVLSSDEAALQTSILGGGGTVNVDDGGGPVLTNVNVHVIFWGANWTVFPTPSIVGIEEAFTSIISGPYMTALTQYRGIQRGHFNGYTIIPSDPPNPFTNWDVSTQIKNLLDNGTVPEPNPGNQIFFVVIMPIGTIPSGTSFVGEHTFFFYNDLDNPSSSQNIYFAWLTNNGSLDFLTEIFSHELVETCSDPDGTAFQILPRNNFSWNEIADSGCGCQSVDTRINGVLVQKYWSQQDNTCVAPASDIIDLVNKVTLSDTSDIGPALASHGEHLFLAWKDADDGGLNIIYSSDGGLTFTGKHVSDERSDASPALVSHNGQLFIAWKGSGNDNLNVANISLFADNAGEFGIEGLVDKVILSERSSTGPSLASLNNGLYIAWKGSGNDNLNVAMIKRNSSVS